MSLGFLNRVSKYPNRYKVTAEDGSSYYVTLERADEPTQEGTPLNAVILNQLATMADVKKLPNMYLWKKYEGDPSVCVETEVSDHTLSSKLSGATAVTYSNVTYGDSYSYSNGTITLENRKTVTPSSASDLQTILRGMYVLGTATNGNLISIFYIPEDAIISETTATSGYLTFLHLDTDKATEIKVNQYIGYVMDEASDAYPAEGTHEDDGYWYVYHKQFGD